MNDQKVRRDAADEIEYLQKALLCIGEAIIAAANEIRPILKAHAVDPPA